MELAVLAAVLALFVSLGALWLVGNIQNKIDFQNDTFSQVHIKPLRAELKAVESHIKILEQKVGGLDELFDKTENVTKNQEEIRHVLKSQLLEIHQKIEVLDHSIPQRYRTAVKQKEQPTKPKEKPKEKPSI